MSGFSRANHASTNFKKFLSWKTRQVYLIYPFPRRLKLGESLETCSVNFFRLSWHFKREEPSFWKASFLQKQGLITRTSFVRKTSRLVRISLLISALNKRVLLFSLESYFKKSNRKFFAFVCISWYKHSRGWENSRPLCKPETKSSVCTKVSNSPNPSRVYIRLFKHGKRFLLLKYNPGSGTMTIYF